MRIYKHEFCSYCQGDGGEKSKTTCPKCHGTGFSRTGYFEFNENIILEKLKEILKKPRDFRLLK